MAMEVLKNKIGNVAKNYVSNLAERIVRAATSHWNKTNGSYAIESIDPIRNLTAMQAQQIFNCARSGNYSQIQRIYAEIERTDPTLLVCVMRRASAISELDWKVVRSDERLFRGATEEQVNAQIEFLETLCARISNLSEAIEFLSTASFRGFANISPVYRVDGSIKRFDLLDQWNMCWDRRSKQWLWNPEASSFELAENIDGMNGYQSRLQVIPNEELVTVTERNPIDWPALMIFLRKSTAEHDWGVFVERYGIPRVILTMPENIDPEDVDKFVEGSQAIHQGENGCVPFGTIVNYAAEARGIDPFTAFINHQQELIVLMATGGTLTSLTAPGSGTLAGNAHEDTWRTIVRRVARIIADALNKQLFEPLLKKAFPDHPVLAEFKFETTPDPTPREVFELAVMARNAGLEMKTEEISQMTGYTLTRENSMMGTPETDEMQTMIQSKGTAVAVNSKIHNGTLTDAERLAIALKADFADAAKAINEVLIIDDDTQRRNKASELVEQIDNLVPNDPIMAGVIADTMEREFLNVMKT